MDKINFGDTIQITQPSFLKIPLTHSLLHYNLMNVSLRKELDRVIILSYFSDTTFDQQLVLQVINSPEGNYDHRDESGKTVLHCACERGHVQVVSSLVDANADLEVRDNHGHGVLHYLKKETPHASRRWDYMHMWNKESEILQIIIDAGFHIDRNEFQQCVVPISYAIRKNWSKRKLVRNLLEEIGFSEWCTNVGEFLDFLFQPKTALNLFMSLPPS